MAHIDRGLEQGKVLFYPVPRTHGCLDPREGGAMPTTNPGKNRDDREATASRPTVPAETTLREQYQRTLNTLRRTEGAYSRFVPDGVLALLGAHDILDVHLGDMVEKRLTVMFTDIRDFTAMSEHMTSRETFAFLNDYLGHMEPAVRRHGGVVDKFIGDAVMALFPDGADQAVRAALAMREALSAYNDQRRESGLAPVDMGIGLNSGLATLGILGHGERVDSTVIGDVVNVAQRIEGLTKTYRVNILVSEDTLASLDAPHAVAIRFIDRVRVKGRVRPISVYEVFDGDPPATARAKRKHVETFEKAVAYYHLRAIDRALPLFEACAAALPNDTVVEIYLARCRAFVATGAYDGIGELLDHMEWKASYETGLHEMDEQHRTLMDNINRLSDAIQAEDSKAVGEVFSFLERYSIEHFAMEESLMDEYEYPFRDGPKQEHAAFIRGFTTTRDEIISGLHDRILCLFRINLFLYDWLISHSTRVDKHLAAYVADQTSA